MQSFSQFGFRVEPYFTTTQLEYEALKTCIEKIGHMAEKMPNGISAIILEDGKNWLTVHKMEHDINIGIYQMKNKSLSTDIVHGYPPITEKKCQALLHRMEIYSQRKETMHHIPIESAWRQFLQKEPVNRENNRLR